MHVAVIGAGPTGLVCGAGLARLGHAHNFRGQVVDVLQELCPGAYDAWRADGAEPVPVVMPDGQERLMGVLSRRVTFEAAVRRTALATPGVELRRGHVDGVLVEDGNACGLVVDGAPLPADVVLDAAGRSSRVTRDLRAAPLSGGPTGIAYTDRVYRLRPGAEPGPLANPMLWTGDFDRYQGYVIRHEQGIFSVLLIRPDSDVPLRRLRETPVFDAVMGAIPALAAWTDPERAEPLTEPLPGGAMTNWFRSQSDLPGLVVVGDAVCTTTPIYGRGVTTSLLQARELVSILGSTTDPVEAADTFGSWSLAAMKPWVDDHVAIDTWQRRRWQGEETDDGGPLPSHVVAGLLEDDPDALPAMFPYFGMLAGPSSLDPLQPLARARYDAGARPALADGPSRDELVALAERAA